VTSGYHALVIESSPELRRVVERLLIGKGLTVDTAADAATGLRLAREHDPAVVVLDDGLPDLDGCGACRSLREFSDAYVLMLSVRAGDEDKVRGFDAGADDYLVKPLCQPEFVARIEAVLRRQRRLVLAAPRPSIRRFGALTIDPVAREATLDGRTLRLTPREFGLLDCLSASPGVAFTRAELLEHVWGVSWFGDDHLVSVHISNLRRKLGDDGRDPAFVVTVRGIGFRMGPGREPVAP